jgi:hypothetical protein
MLRMLSADRWLSPETHLGYLVRGLWSAQEGLDDVVRLAVESSVALRLLELGPLRQGRRTNWRTQVDSLGEFPREARKRTAALPSLRIHAEATGPFEFGKETMNLLQAQRDRVFRVTVDETSQALTLVGLPVRLHTCYCGDEETLGRRTAGQESRESAREARTRKKKERWKKNREWIRASYDQWQQGRHVEAHWLDGAFVSNTRKLLAKILRRRK